MLTNDIRSYLTDTNSSMARCILMVTFVLLHSCKSEQPPLSSTQLDLDHSMIDSLAPIMLDDIHYYTQDRAGCNAFFQDNFGTKAMVEESPNPFEFIDFLLVKSGQSTINISKRGPFPGIAVGDPKRWEREFEAPSPDNPPRYGVHWLALSTSSLDQTIEQLEGNQVTILDQNFSLPHDNIRAILCHGPDYNNIVITERSRSAAHEYEIDHLLLLVEDLAANKRFFEDVFRGKSIDAAQHHIHMIIGNHHIVLAEPEALGIERSSVIKRDPKVYRPDIDHLGFLYEDIQPAYDHAVSLGYKFLGPPNPIKYYDKPTLYKFAITFSPDGLQCEMYEEQGRVASRTKYKNL